MDLDDLEKQWENGDDEEELRTEQQTKFERLERRRKEAQENGGTIDPRCERTYLSACAVAVVLCRRAKNFTCVHAKGATDPSFRATLLMRLALPHLHSYRG